jgi:hypothetical protein
MSLLTVAGITLTMQPDFKEGPLRKGGSVQPAYAGNLLSTVRWTKRSFSGTTAPMLSAAVNTLLIAVALDTQVPVAGDLIGATLTCMVDAGDKQVVPANGGDGLGFMWTLFLSINQV